MIKQSRINYDGFIKLRNDITFCIEAVKCKGCSSILSHVSDKSLQRHRAACKNSSGIVANDSFFAIDGDAFDCTSNAADDIVEVKRDIDKKLAKFFYSCGISFRSVENPYFHDFISALQGINFKYSPPCRRTLATSVLSSVHNDLTNIKKMLLKDTHSILLTDEWRNKVANKKLLVFTLKNIHVSQCFLSVVDVSVERGYSEILAEHIKSAIQLAEELYETKVVAIISDNDSKIVCAGRLIEEKYNRKLIQNTYASHSGNLLIKSLVPLEFCNLLRDVVNEFRDPKHESLLIKAGGSKLKNYPDTRFCFVRETCETIYKNLHFLRDVILLPDTNFSDECKEVLLSEKFERDLENTIDIVTPVCQLINTCQGSSVTVADATEMWLSISFSESKFQEELNKRLIKCIHPVGFAANLLHNKYQGIKLTEEQILTACKFMKKYSNTDTYAEFEYFLDNRQQFQKYEENCCPISYWSLCGYKLPLLSQFALDIIIIPASTAELEGIFSKWTFVHNLYRNKLGDNKSSVLADLYHSLKLSSITDYNL